MDDDSSDDPWVTLAEIAEELRMSPATIRSWVANGTLAATRAGQRKWLVRRSEIDRLLAGRDLDDDPEPDGLGERTFDTISPPGSSPHWREPEALEHVGRSGWLGVAETTWRDALASSAMAPPDAGFVDRLAEIAEAAARKAAALANLAAEPPGPWWERQSALPGGSLSYELRPGANRPGPAQLWIRFDGVVDRLNDAMRSHSAPAEQVALEQLSLVLHDIVDELDDEGEADSEDVGEADDGVG